MFSKKSPMVLTDLRIEKSTYGKDVGQYKGRARFSSNEADVNIEITHEHAVAILDMCAERMIEVAHEMAGVIRSNVIEGMSVEGTGRKLLK